MTWYHKHPSALKTHRIEMRPMPLLAQEAPIAVKAHFGA